ncbi:MAG: hypothetical protein KME26_09055 [Oscillatoria princeps RMCB-10]|jgi:hypothetical protein|nr:hypothetical protein [Oscillatoria princeps RMCB-10]
MLARLLALPPPLYRLAHGYARFAHAPQNASNFQVKRQERIPDRASEGEKGICLSPLRDYLLETTGQSVRESQAGLS